MATPLKQNITQKKEFVKRLCKRDVIFLQNKQENKKGKLHYIGGRNDAKDITKITESLQLCYKMSKSLARKNGISYNVFSKREST